MNARIEISIEANDANGIEDKLREIAGQSLNWTWTNGGSPKQISKHVGRLCFDAVHRYGAVELAERPFQPSPNDDFNNQKTRLDGLLRPSFFVF